MTNQQINLIGQRTDQWNRGDLWLMTIAQKPQVDAFVWKGASSMWPIPKDIVSNVIHVVLNQRWSTLKDRYQWKNFLQSLWNKYIEPKKSCLA